MADTKRFSVYHFHNADDDFFFTTELRDTFYSAAYSYRKLIQDGNDNLTLDSIASIYYSDYNPIDELNYSVLCDAMPNDFRISMLIKFDFENGTVDICDSSDNAWRVYNLDDVIEAVSRAERKPGLHLETRREIFEEALAGKEIYYDDENEIVDEDSSPTMQM